MHSSKITFGVLLTLAPFATAQVEPSNLVIAYPTSSASSVEYYDEAGGLVGGIAGPDSSWISSALMPDGGWVVHNNSGSVGLHFLTSVGVYQYFVPITVSDYSSDIGTFSDGIIAVCSRGEGLLLFDHLGNPQGVINPTGMMAPMGLTVEYDDTVWVADLMAWPGSTDGKIWHVDRSGTVLHSFDTTFDPMDVDVGLDGTIWVCGWQGEVAHYDPDGTLLNQFDAVIDSTLKTTWSLAVGDDGRVWVSGHYDSKVRSYFPDGTVASEFDTVASGQSTFTFMALGNAGAVSYCSGDGSGAPCPCGNSGATGKGCANSTIVGASLVASGSANAVMDNLSFDATDLIPNQPALLFVGNNAVNGGLGRSFGDGLRCAGGGLVRLGVQVADGVGGASWGPGLRAIGRWGPGDTRYYQVWYLDPGGSPCGVGVNLTQGLEVVFAP